MIEVWIGIALVVIVVAVVVTVAMHVRRANAERAAELSALASRLGWSFDPARVDWKPEWAAFQRGFSRGRFNTLEGSLELAGRARAARAGDYRFVISTGKSTAVISFSYLSVASPFAPTPKLIVRRVRMRDRFARLFRMPEVDLGTDEVRRSVRVLCADPGFARDLLQPRTIDRFRNSPVESLESSGGSLVITSDRRRWSAEQFTAGIALVGAVVDEWSKRGGPAHPPSRA